MTTAQHTLAVLFPGADNKQVAEVSAKYHVEVERQEEYSLQKDYERYFKPSRYIFHKNEISLLFVFADGSAQLVNDMPGLKNVMSKMKHLVGLQ